MKNKRNFKKNNAITLIALVVTIVVLLILAGVSIAMLTGENGIIKQAQNANEKTEQAKVEELVKLAINGLLTANKGDKNLITPEMIANQINKDENRTDVKAEGTTFPTNIIFGEERRKVEVDIDLSIKEGTGDIPETEATTIFGSVDEMSEEDLITEANENMDLFEYEIIDTAEVGATDLNSLPTKTAKITQIKEIYCNHIASNEPLYDENNNEYYDTNYEIIYKGKKITDTLVVPYQVEIDGEMYKITEAFLGVRFEEDNHLGYTLPRVETIIYPNTIETISGANTIWTGSGTIATSKIKNIILPDNLKNIGYGAFFYCEDLTNITIPDTVTTIESYAFFRCTSLSNITIPEGVTSIGEYAFSYCTGLTSITIPSSVTSIGEYAFSYCTGLTSITIPSSVTSIEDYTFWNCTGLTSITIPSSVTSIGKYAFYSCKGLTNIEIPNSVTSIGELAFSDTQWYKNKPNGEIYINNVFYKYKGSMPSNTTIVLKDHTVCISGEAFYNCTGLTDITIPNSVTNVGYNAFYNTQWLKDKPDGEIYINNIFYKYKGTMPSNTTIKLKDNTICISDGAFDYCSGLTSITIPNGVTKIGYRAFSSCKGLTNITIPNSVTSIGDYAFSNCTGLTNITIPNSVTSIGEGAFSDCTGLTNIEIPNSVTSIRYGTFSWCTALTSITIPRNVTKIGDAAFNQCTNLSQVYFEQTKAPVFEYNCFYKWSGLKTTFYFKNSIVADAFTTSCYNSSYGEKSTDYNW